MKRFYMLGDNLYMIDVKANDNGVTIDRGLIIHNDPTKGEIHIVNYTTQNVENVTVSEATRAALKQITDDKETYLNATDFQISVINAAATLTADQIREHVTQYENRLELDLVNGNDIEFTPTMIRLYKLALELLTERPENCWLNESSFEWMAINNCIRVNEIQQLIDTQEMTESELIEKQKQEREQAAKEFEQAFNDWAL